MPFLYNNGVPEESEGSDPEGKVEATDGDMPIGDLKSGSGNDVNNYTQPNIPVQGMLTRLLNTKD